MAEVRQGLIVHHIPGRLRVRLPSGQDAGLSPESLCVSLARLRGVEQVTVTPRTRSLLIRYDPDVLGPADLGNSARAAGLTLVAPRSLPQATGRSGAVWRSWGVLHRLGGVAAAGRSAGGGLDLRAAMPLGVVGLALYQIVRGNLRTTPWYLVLWLAAALLRRLRQPPRRGNWWDAG